MEDLTIITLNIQGSYKKQKHIRSLIDRHKTDFIFLQETNFKNMYTAEKYTHSLGITEAHHSLCRTTLGSGTTILNTSNKYKIIDTYTDTEGKLAIATIQGKEIKMHLVNIHGPADRRYRAQYYKKLEETLLKNYITEQLIMAGDFNSVQEELDMLGKEHRIKRRMSDDKSHTTVINNILKVFSLVDTFRTLHPTTRQVTHGTKSSQGNHNRLDRIYVPKNMKINKAEHLKDTLKYSDHSATLVQLNHNTIQHKRTSYWK